MNPTGGAKLLKKYEKNKWKAFISIKRSVLVPASSEGEHLILILKKIY